MAKSLFAAIATVPDTTPQHRWERLARFPTYVKDWSGSDRYFPHGDWGVSMRQIIYVSLGASSGTRAEIDMIIEKIVQEARHYNAIDGITGLLWADGQSYLQVFEGPTISVRECFTRIYRDRRHHSITIIADRLIENPEFGSWNMVHRGPDSVADEYDHRISHFLSEISESTRDQFAGLVANAPRAAM